MIRTLYLPMSRFTPRHIRILSIIIIMFLIIVGISTYAIFAEEIEDQKLEHPSIVYLLRSTDLISVKVYGQDDLTFRQRIDGKGLIQMPLVGKIEVVGLSIRDCESHIEKELVDQKYLRSPQVSVHIEEYSPKSVSIFGEINNPGKIDFNLEANAIDIIDIIALAGDFTGIAKKGDVVVTRIGENGQEQTFEVDVQKRILGKGKEKIFWVYPGDVIYIPESLF